MERKLRALNFAAYCPTIERKKRSRYDRSRLQVTLRPLYPGYLFCGIEHALAAEQAQYVLKIPVTLLRRSETLLALTEMQMRLVCETEFSNHEFVQDQVVAQIKETDKRSTIEPNQFVRVIEGVLGGRFGVVVGVRDSLASVELSGGVLVHGVPVAILKPHKT